MPLDDDQFAELVRRLDDLGERFDALLAVLAKRGQTDAPAVDHASPSAPTSSPVSGRRGIDQELRAPDHPTK